MATADYVLHLQQSGDNRREHTILSSRVLEHCCLMILLQLEVIRTYRTYIEPAIPEIAHMKYL